MVLVNKKVTPGDRLGSLREIATGTGTYARGTHVYASLLGTVALASGIKKDDVNPAHTAPQHLPVVTVIPLHEKTAASQVLVVGQVVLVRIVRVSTQQAAAEIVAADGLIGALKDLKSGVIRKEDVKSGATEDVKIYDSFRPNDIVIAKIISLGDTKRYFLSTAEAELGVIRAISSSSGKYMIPVNYKEMECPETKIKEPRKCAKPNDADGTYKFYKEINLS